MRVVTSFDGLPNDARSRKERSVFDDLRTRLLKQFERHTIILGKHPYFPLEEKQARRQFQDRLQKELDRAFWFGFMCESAHLIDVSDSDLEKAAYVVLHSVSPFPICDNPASKGIDRSRLTVTCSCGRRFESRGYVWHVPPDTLRPTGVMMLANRDIFCLESFRAAWRRNGFTGLAFSDPTFARDRKAGEIHQAAILSHAWSSRTSLCPACGSPGYDNGSIFASKEKFKYDLQVVDVVKPTSATYSATYFILSQRVLRFIRDLTDDRILRNCLPMIPSLDLGMPAFIPPHDRLG